MRDSNEVVRHVLKKNQKLVGASQPFKAPAEGHYEGDRLPAYVKCKECGKGPIGADWLKPVNSDPACREFIHLSHIPNGPILPQAVERVRRV
jgi:hypothetical protein